MSTSQNDFSQLENAVEEFCVFIDALPQDLLVDQTWGPKEVLAHLVYWHEVYLDQARSFLRGEPPYIPEGRYHDLNALAVENSRDVRVPELTERFRAVNRTLRQLYGECDPQTVVIPIKSGVRSYTLAELIPEVIPHVRNHLIKLRREFREAKLVKK